jgi:hypothetical protein
MSGSSSLTINGNVTLQVSGNIALCPSGSITLTINSGGSLTIYVNGSFSVGTASLNWGGAPGNFIIYGGSGCTSMTLGNGSVTMCAAIYAPDANVTMNCSWYNGSLIANSITGSGSFDFYYDVNLANLSTGISGFKMISWREI